jgi:hypothetical protein
VYYRNTSPHARAFLKPSRWQQKGKFERYSTVFRRTDAAKIYRSDGGRQSRHHAGIANQELIDALFCHSAAFVGCRFPRRCPGSDASAATGSAVIAR